MHKPSATEKEISCRITSSLIKHVRETNGSLGGLLKGLELSEEYLTDTNNWVSHAFIQVLYDRMIDLLSDPNAVYNMVLASKNYLTWGILDWIGRLLGKPKLIYSRAPKYNRLLKTNGDVYVRAMGDCWVVLEDRYHSSAQKTRHDCDYTRAMLAAIPTIFDMPLAHVEELECQVAPEVYGERIWPDAPRYGCKGCLYRIQWEPLERPPLWRRIFQRYNVYQKAIQDLQNTNQMIQEKYDQVRKLARDLEVANRELAEAKQKTETYMAELESSELRYRLLAENVTDTIWTMSLNPLRFTYVSPSVRKMRGYSPEEAAAMSLAETLTPDSMQRASAVLAAELAREAEGNHDPDRSATLELQQTCKDGQTRWVETKTTFLRDENGKAVGLLGVARDISERKLAEKFYQAKIVAEAANAAKSDFLSKMSHELRTPLNHIIGFSELLLDESPGRLNETQQEYLSAVHNSSLHLLTLVNDVLDISVIEIDKLELHPSEIRLRELLEQTLSSFRDQAGEKDLELVLETDEIPDVITADELRLKQIIGNLLSNAVKFTPSGGRVCLGAQTLSGNTARPARRLLQNEVQIRVADSGIGIRPEDADKIFEPFLQIEGSLNRKYSGTGVGLFLSRKIVELHGGRIWMESEGLGQGSVFRFTLPF